MGNMCRKYRLDCPTVDHRENSLNTFVQWCLLFTVWYKFTLLFSNVWFYFVLFKAMISEKWTFNEILNTEFPFLKKLGDANVSCTKFWFMFIIYGTPPKDTNILKKRQHLLQKLVIIFKRLFPKESI